MMSDLEIHGFIFGAVGILTAFKGALDTALLINSYVDDEETGCGYLALRYHVEKTRLNLWRQVYNIKDPSTCPLRYKPTMVHELVVKILGEITRLFDDLQTLVTRHQIGPPVLPPNENTNAASHSPDALAKALSKVTVTPKARFLWTIKGKAEFEMKISRISTLVDDLQSFTVNASELQSLDNALPSISLRSITSAELLQILHDPKTRTSAALAASARVKLLRENSAQSPDESVTVFKKNRLRFLQNSSTLGILRSSAAGRTPVWVEWNVISDGAGACEYIRQIKALGYLLEEVGSPALSLPVCYGVFDDVVYNSEFGTSRFGYVFGAPHADRNPPPSHTIPGQPPLPRYEENFCDYPPRTLSSLIRDYESFPVPLLGDRFTLAFTLATAFSHFHSAGWLHRGFHSGNIIFLTHTSGQEVAIRVTDPFITGFQYARPADGYSLIRGPLQNRELDYYYHPSADKGFSRRIDLYSLGVVLCEIGQWGLVGTTMLEETRREMVDRTAWRNYLVSKVLADIGWRMGEKYQAAVQTLLECRLPDDDRDDDDVDGGFFEQQYFEKVIQPLSACSA
jgi:hypothetical protein